MYNYEVYMMYLLSLCTPHGPLLDPTNHPAIEHVVESVTKHIITFLNSVHIVAAVNVFEQVANFLVTLLT